MLKEATAGFEPAMGVLQTPALPLGDVAALSLLKASYQWAARMSNSHGFTGLCKNVNLGHFPNRLKPAMIQTKRGPVQMRQSIFAPSAHMGLHTCMGLDYQPRL